MRGKRQGGRRALAVVALTGLCSAAPPGSAQVLLQRPVNAGDVTGLELGIEGSTTVLAGGRARLLLAAQEVVGLDGLRPGAQVRVRALASFSPQRALAEVRTDALGRAAVQFDVPADAPPTFHLILEAVADRGVRRQFEFDMTVRPPTALWLEADRTQARPGDRVTVWGRLSAAGTGRALEGQTVTLEMVDQEARVVRADVHARTDGAGGFSTSFELPGGGWSALTVRAHAGSREYPVQAQTQVALVSLQTPTLRMQAVALPRVVRAGAQVTVEAVVRTGDGRPVRGAVVTSARIPRPAGMPAAETPSLRTDAQGRVHFQFAAPAGMGSYSESPVQLSATRAGLGNASAAAPLRVTATALLGTVSVEGGALMPGARGRLYVRVVGPDGLPAGAGVAVTVRGPRLSGALMGTTGAGGVAMLEVAVSEHPAAPPRTARPAAAQAASDEGEEPAQDSCGGATATQWSATLARDGAQAGVEGCLALDPDATVRVHVEGEPVVQAGGRVAVSLERLASVSRWPVEVALVRVEGSTLSPLVARTLSAGENRAELEVPGDVHGVVLVRARPLHPGDAVAVRGGMSALWVLPGARWTGQVAVEGDRVVAQGRWAQGAAQEPATALVAVLPREQGEALLTRVRARAGALLGELRVEPTLADNVLLGGALAALTPVDDGAPSVWREGHMVPVPAPEEPGERGILRDPWRARARFVEGRLALLFRELEEHVAERLYERRGDVAVRGPGGRWGFNREIFDAILSGREERDSTLGRSLGGAPLSIEVLARLDPAFTYDNVARRLTRRRMFSVLLALRHFVNERALDLRWSWRGDPTVWLRALVENSVSVNEDGTALTEPELRDGWGNPLALRPAPGGHNRFTLLAPVPGFDLVSAGPDERFGTADDVVDPTARVLPSGGAFARAVDEDGLLARLHGVELGRATVRGLSQLFSVEAREFDANSEDSRATTTPAWDALPSVATLDAHALELVRPQVWVQAHTQALAQFGAAAQTAPLALDDEPRSWMAVLEAWSAAGVSATAQSVFNAGRPVLLSTSLLFDPDDDVQPDVARLTRGETVTARLLVTNLLPTAQRFELAAQAEGSLAVQGGGALLVPAGETAEATLTLRATGQGTGALRVLLRDQQGQTVRQLRVPLAFDDDALELREDWGGLADTSEPAVLELAVPEGARSRGARLVLLAPTALTADPEFERARQRDPALAAWALTLGGRALPDALAADLLGAQRVSEQPVAGPRGRRGYRAASGYGAGGVSGELPGLSTALAAVVWSGAPENDERSAQARRRALSALASLPRGYPDAEAGAGALRGSAALVAALATGVGSDAAEQGVDPVTAFVETQRAELRGALGLWSRQPTLLARAAAALLLADPSDARALALYEAARRSAPVAAGNAWVHGGEGRTELLEELTGTAALAVAAQQRGDTALAHALLRSLARHAHRAWRAGGDAAFWTLATAAYGVWGVGEPGPVRVRINGAERTVTLRDGRALLELPAAPGASVRVELRGGQVAALGRLELRYGSPWGASSAGPVALSVEGDPGYLGEQAALELTVSNPASRPVERVLLEVALPPACVLDAPARAALSARSSGLEVRDGVLRVTLARVEAGQTLHLPLSLRWLAGGSVRGLGAVAYTAVRPAFMTRLAPRAFEVRERAEP